MRFFLLLLATWCSVSLADDLYKCQVANGRTTYVNGELPGQKCIMISEDKRAPECTGNECSIRLKKHNGHFYVAGAIAGVSVKFMIDTGATVVTIPQKISFEAGLRPNNRVSFRTAGGTVTGFESRNVPVAIGGMNPINVDVATNPTLDVPLLGQNYLRRFRISIEGDVMILTAPSSQPATSQTKPKTEMLVGPGRKPGESCTDTSQCFGLSRCENGVCEKIPHDY